MFDGKRCCLVVLDVINDIVGRGGPIARCAEAAEQRGMMGRVNEALGYARAQGWRVALVRVGFREDYGDAPAGSPIFAHAKALGALRLNTPGTDWHPDLQVRNEDVVFVKKGISAFCGSGFDAWLEAQGIRDLVICGASSIMAVEGTARDAHDLGYACNVLEDACAAPDDALHKRAMEVCGMLGRVLTVAELAKVTGRGDTAP